MDIKQLKKMRGQSNFSNIVTALEKEQSGGKSFVDDRFWRPERDKAGNGSAVIRFLPAADGEAAPWVKVFSYSFKGPTGKWYIENSLTTIGQDDPVSALNSELWESTTDDKAPAREQARRQSRKTHWISNVLIVTDPKHPENNGKVKLFKYGKKIFDKINEKVRPSFADEEAIHVFDLWEGANLKLRIKQQDGFPNYDASIFENVSAVADSDEDILEIMNQVVPLDEFIDPKNFKSYEELKKQLDRVLNAVPGQRTTTAEGDNKADFDDTDPFADDDAGTTAPKAAAAEPTAPVAEEPNIAETSGDDEDLDLDYFKQLASKS